MSEWFCRFFSLRLSKFTQTSCTFQARGVPTCDVPDEKPAQLAAYLPRNPRNSRRARLPRNPRTQKPSVRARAHKKSPDAAQ